MGYGAKTLSSECLALIIENTYLLKNHPENVEALVENAHTLTCRAQLMGLPTAVYLSKAVEVLLRACKTDLIELDGSVLEVIQDAMDLFEQLIATNAKGYNVGRFSRLADECVASILAAASVRLNLGYDFFTQLTCSTALPEKRCNMSLQRSSRRILVADGSKFYRKHMSKYLESSGYKVDTFRCCESALNELNTNCQEKYNCVISEIDISGFGGLDFVKSWKSSRPTSALKFVAVANRASSEERDAGISAGFDRYLEKLNPLELIDVVDEMVGVKGHKVQWTIDTKDSA